MVVRRWVSSAITDGGTILWSAGITVKVVFELGVAVGIGWGLTWIAQWLWGFQTLETYFGGGWFGAVWIGITALVAFQVTLCEWAPVAASSE